MSAWMCGAAHWSALADLIVNKGVDDRTPEEIFQVLAAENKASIDARYAVGIASDPDYMYDSADPFDGGYRPVFRDAVWEPGEIALLVGCYEYQSCEHGGWHASEARRLVGELVENEFAGDAVAASREQRRVEERRRAIWPVHLEQTLWGITWNTLPLSAVQQQ